MFVHNNEKEREKIYLRNNIQSCITNIIYESNEIHNITALLSGSVLGGSLSGADDKIIGQCQRALQEISGALQYLHQSAEYASNIDTREWVDDEYE